MVLQQLEQRTIEEASATIETCDKQLTMKVLMSPEGVAVLVEQKALAHMQLREFNEAIDICNLSLTRNCKNIPFATRDRIRAIQQKAAKCTI